MAQGDTEERLSLVIIIITNYSADGLEYVLASPKSRYSRQRFITLHKTPIPHM